MRELWEPVAPVTGKAVLPRTGKIPTTGQSSPHHCQPERTLSDTPEKRCFGHDGSERPRLRGCAVYQ